MNECPECGKVLRGNKCACGFRQQGHVQKSIEEQRQETYEALRCKWKTSRGQCKLPGSMSGQFGSGATFYCLWHFECLSLSNPTASEDRNEFAEFWRQVEGEKFNERKVQWMFNQALGD